MDTLGMGSESGGVVQGRGRTGWTGGPTKPPQIVNPTRPKYLNKYPYPVSR